MPPVPRGAGIYRFSINKNVGRDIYIGESGNIGHRLLDYRGPYAESEPTTEARLSGKIREALTHGRAVFVDTATTGKINLTGSERPLDMESTAERRFAEAAAVLAEAEQDVDSQIIILNRIKNEYMWSD